MLRDYLSIARPDHWFKNIFVVPGFLLAYWFSDVELNITALLNMLLALVAACLLASANYTINEWLDLDSDRHHPVKKNRPAPSGKVHATGVWLQWGLLSIVGLIVAASVGGNFLVYGASLLFMGLVYNVKPIRSKDRAFWDTLSESINNPIRLMLGVSALAPDIIPPSSIIISYWMGGAYLMAVKRYAEYRFIDDPVVAGNYRRSFSGYSEMSLLLSAFFYALTAAFFLGIFLIKYRIEFILAIPFLATLFVWYLWIGMQTNSVTQNPEKLYREKRFIVYVLFVAALVFALSIVKIPWLNILLETSALEISSH
jgi:decaprenyl-phosphate phosphoribosyltransferase